MAIDIKEVRRRLAKFAIEHAGASEEKQQAQVFQSDFYACFGIERRKSVLLEQRVKTLQRTTNFIDGYIPGKLITEMKSRGMSLDSAFLQAANYATLLQNEPIPPYILVCDFEYFRLFQIDDQKIVADCVIADLPKYAEFFMFLTGQETVVVEETLINREAAYAIAKLHKALLDARFVGHDLEVFLTRLLFCLFADDTGIFGARQMFVRLLQASKPDGTDLKGMLQTLFDDILDVPINRRQTTAQGQTFDQFAYVNGDLFKERTRIPAFDGAMRDLLLSCAIDLDWSQISPAIFGAMFQGVLEDAALENTAQKRTASRRELGAHYTSERNILRVIKPLFLDALRTEFDAAKARRDNKKSLIAFYEKLPTLTFLDPACGCGNFLVIAYREIRQLEHDVIESIWGKGGLLDVKTQIRVNVSQFYGIEIDEAAAHIARVALYITDEQMNQVAGRRFGQTRPTVPIAASPTIVRANALQTDWATVLKPEACHYVLGNPPFVGKKEQTSAQKADMERVFVNCKGAGVLDFVAAWYLKAAHYMQQGTGIQTAFVSTNSITQGEQVAVLWSALARQGVSIRFAHRTFKWTNEGKGIAAVHCVIIGFGLSQPTQCLIYDYADDVKSDPIGIVAKQINPYLVDAPNVFLEKRKHPISKAPAMNYGSMPIDNGKLILTVEQYEEAIASDPNNAALIRPYSGGEEFLNNSKRYCLWLDGMSPSVIKRSKFALERLRLVEEFRRGSDRATTQKLADVPGLFGEIRQPTTNYLLIPKVSSENRRFMPIGFVDHNTIASGSALIIPSATLYDFGVLSSTMHNAWMRAVCGRLESRYQYSSSLVYNNYPWPQKVSPKQLNQLEAAVEAVRVARGTYPDATLADMYSEMHKELVKAHRDLDKTVDAIYGYKGESDDASRVKFLFALHNQIASPLVAVKRKKP
jgi:N-6 DNA Methylase